MKKEDEYISCCEKYYCAFCDYYRGTIVEAAKKLLEFVERYGSLKLIANANSACNFDELMKGKAYNLPQWRYLPQTLNFSVFVFSVKNLVPKKDTVTFSRARSVEGTNKWVTLIQNASKKV